MANSSRASAHIWLAKIDSAPATPFARRVWKAMLKIPRGKVASYQTIAKMAGSSRAARAVGNACNQNPFAPDVPCHRVVSSSGKLGGYAHGSAKKIALLKSEGILVRENNIVDFENVVFKSK